MFITFEGTEGSGKSTQANMLADYLRAQFGENKVLLTREPGGTRIGEQIREVVHSQRNQELVAATEFLLYNAARAQVVAEVIRPALAQGKIVLSDRFADSTLAYQGYGRQLDLDMVRKVIEFATGGLKPDVTFYFDVTVDEGLARRKNGQKYGGELNRMDSQTREFYERVYEGYCKLMREEPTRWFQIDGSQSIERVQMDLRSKLERFLVQSHHTPKTV